MFTWRIAAAFNTVCNVMVERVRKHYVMHGWMDGWLWSNLYSTYAAFFHFILHLHFFLVSRWGYYKHLYNYHYLRHMHVQLIQMCENFNVTTFRLCPSLSLNLAGSSYPNESFRHIGHYRMWNETPLWVYARYVFNTMNITIMVLLPEQICYGHILLRNI